MAHPKFVLGSSTFQFSRGIQYPVSRPLEKIQVTDRTAAGLLQVETFGPVINTRRLVFRNLPAADYAGLMDWFDNVANGAANQFTYYDEDGASMTVIIVTKKLDFQQTSYQRYSGELLLEVQS